MLLKDLAPGYRSSAQMLSERIEELKAALAATEDETEQSLLKARLYILKKLRKENLELAELCENYYERSYHANEQYSAQQTWGRVVRKSSKVDGGVRGKQRGGCGTRETKPETSDRRGADFVSADLFADVLLRGKEHARDRRRPRR